MFISTSYVFNYGLYLSYADLLGIQLVNALSETSHFNSSCWKLTFPRKNLVFISPHDHSKELILN